METAIVLARKESQEVLLACDGTRPKQAQKYLREVPRTRQKF
jgi:hypothetical protein